MTNSAKTTSAKSPLAKVRGLGSGKSGTHHFIMQRLTAFALIPLFLYFIYSVISLTGTDYAGAKDYISNPFHAVMLGLFVIAGFHHGQLGVQVIIEDYVHGKLAKLFLLILLKLFSFMMAAFALFSIIKIAVA